MESNVGLGLESKKDNAEDSKKEKERIDWGLVFAILKNRGFSYQEILDLSYPQLNVYMNNINNPLACSITIPYMGSGEEEGKATGTEIGSKEELLALVADMNRDFS